MYEPNKRSHFFFSKEKLNEMINELTKKRLVFYKPANINKLTSRLFLFFS